LIRISKSRRNKNVTKVALNSSEILFQFQGLLKAKVSWKYGIALNSSEFPSLQETSVTKLIQTRVF